MKIALVHELLLKLGGAERVCKALLDLYPEAPVFTLLYDEKKMGKVFPSSRVRTSFLQNYPNFIKKRHRLLLSKMPRAIEEMDFSEFDVVISSSSAFAHGIITNTNTMHVCYCHSPMRYAWDWTNEYIKENEITGIKRLLYAPVMKYIREWDKSASDRPDFYLSNSFNVKNRLKKYYGSESEVVPPPVDVSSFNVGNGHENYFLIVSTLSPYKNIELAIHTFNKIGKRLIIIGDGSNFDYLSSISGENIDFLGFKDDKTVKTYMENCRALIFPGEEDFGITPLEANACGKPVLAYAKGGALETVIPGKTGEFFFNNDVQSMEDGLARLLYNERFYKPLTIRKHACEFSTELFKKNIKQKIEQYGKIFFR